MAVACSQPPPLKKIQRRHELRYTDRFSETTLRTWRRKGDPLADAVVQELASTSDLKNIHDLLGQVREKAIGDTGVFHAFLHEVHSLPGWVDFSKMERGQRMVTTYMPHMYISLSQGSLVAVGAQFPKLVDVVQATGMLSSGKESEYRLARTSRFVVGLTTPGELQPGRQGHDGILRIRLLHAAVRHYVVKRGIYNESEEVAINQHDLAITLGLFGYVNLRSMRRLGVSFSHDDVDSFIHMWRYVGWVLGIDNGLLPQDFEMQQEFFLASTLMMGDDFESAGADVAKAYKAVPKALARKTKGVIPTWMGEGILFHTMNLLAGEEYLRGVSKELPRGKIGRPAPWFIAGVQASGRITSFIDQYIPFGGRALSAANMAFARSIMPSNEKSPHQLRSSI